MNLEYSMLNSLPSEIKDMRKNLISMTAEMELINSRIKKWESSEMMLISNELDENGKPQFSNAEKRQAELERRKANDKTICGLENDYEAIKKEVEELRIEVSYKFDIQENLRALSRVGGGQV